MIITKGTIFNIEAFSKLLQKRQKASAFIAEAFPLQLINPFLAVYEIPQPIYTTASNHLDGFSVMFFCVSSNWLKCIISYLIYDHLFTGVCLLITGQVILP